MLKASVMSNAHVVTIMALCCVAGFLCPGPNSNQASTPAPTPKSSKVAASDSDDKHGKTCVQCPIALVHDFGAVEKGAPCIHTFHIRNMSGAPLRIVEVRSY